MWENKKSDQKEKIKKYAVSFVWSQYIPPWQKTEAEEKSIDFFEYLRNVRARIIPEAK